MKPKVKFFTIVGTPMALDKASDETAEKINEWLAEREKTIDITEIHQSTGGNDTRVVTTIAIWYRDYSDSEVDLSAIEPTHEELG